MGTDDFALELTGPLDGPVPMSVGDIDLGAIGYVEEEYVCSGVATGYEGEPTEDGRWTASPASTAPFTTRFVINRPASPAAFNGTVVVEWLNVSGGGDGGPDWMFLHREITRSGMAWVGVSAQKVGIDGGASLGAGGSHLKATSPERYGILEHPGDAFSYDMYTQVARVLRGDLGRSVLGDLRPERILAIGESQSAAFLVTYVNGVDPLAQVFDGF
ncbi:MAG: alpha/beta hydrolase domain-containing protein, partial [Acidimicrobiia bacterium]